MGTTFEVDSQVFKAMENNECKALHTTHERDTKPGDRITVRETTFDYILTGRTLERIVTYRERIAGTNVVVLSLY